jgi:hypothetical protein
MVGGDDGASVHATQREFQKMGKVLSATETYGSQMEARPGSRRDE